MHIISSANNGIWPQRICFLYDTCDKFGGDQYTKMQIRQMSQRETMKGGRQIGERNLVAVDKNDVAFNQHGVAACQRGGKTVCA